MKMGVVSIPHKVGNGISTRWVSLFCIASFFLGVLVVNRFWAAIDADDIDEEVSSSENHQSISLQAAHSAVNCVKKEATDEAGDIFSQVSQTHDVIRKLDKTISALEGQLAATRASKSDNNEGSPVVTKSGSESFKERQKVFFVMRIMTAFSSRKRRDSLSETWMPGGGELKKLEKEKGIIMWFVIGHIASSGGVLDRAIDVEDEKHKDFFRLNHLEGYHELSTKTQTYFTAVVNKSMYVGFNGLELLG